MLDRFVDFFKFMCHFRSSLSFVAKFYVCLYCLLNYMWQILSQILKELLSFYVFVRMAQFHCAYTYYSRVGILGLLVIKWPIEDIMLFMKN